MVSRTRNIVGKLRNSLNNCNIFINGITSSAAATARKPDSDDMEEQLKNCTLTSMVALGDWFLWT